MAPGALLPAWVPTDALFLGLLALVLAAVVMNRSRSWAIKALDLNEPLVVGIGVLTAALSGWVSKTLGAGSPDAWLAIGLLVAAFGIFARFSDRVDL